MLWLSCAHMTDGVTRERAGAAMAAVDRRMPNLDDFVGLNWSCWIDTVNIETSDDTKYGRDRCETMTLRKEDMPIYGHCPAQDDFYVVVCSHCGKLVKPQAFAEHCDQRHGSLTKACVPSSSAPLQQPRTSRPSQTVPKDRQRDIRPKEAIVPASSSQRRPGKPQKEATSLPAVDKTQDKTHPALPQRPEVNPQSLHSQTTLAPPLSHPPLQLPLKIKAETDLPTVASSPRDSESSPVKTKVPESQSTPKEHPSRCSKFTVNNSHIGRVRDTSETFPTEENPVVEVEVQPPYPFNQSLPSSDNSDNEEDCPDVPSSPWHPKPLGLCSFGCRAFGCSVFTFDRRLHHLRIALSAMLEDHVNSHLWRKIPQPTSNLMSAHATSSTRGSPVRIGARSNATGSSNVKTTSLESLKNPQNISNRTKSPPSAPAVSSSLGQMSVVQSNKAHTGQKELKQSTKTALKPQLSRSASSKHIAPFNALIPGSFAKKPHRYRLFAPLRETPQF
ncbi:hypothetical protein WMY93_030383 [Mugilogobius chulae]|uniref:Ataxin-7-like protein 2 n=1 Tax=Mugilogobius chulae TaxID=88201 RepID=A0AAW0MHK5_9GOBI